jgi:hypothetical protein
VGVVAFKSKSPPRIGFGARLRPLRIHKPIQNIMTDA